MQSMIRSIRSFLALFVCIMQMQFVQSPDTVVPSQLGKGIIYLKERSIIKNILLKEIKAYWIIYQKDGSFHDKMMDEILRIEFPNANPEPIVMEFVNNKMIVKKISIYH